MIIMAWRNIWRNKMRSIVIMLSIAIGLFAGVAVMALYNGMQASKVRTVIDAEVGHLQVHDTNFKKEYEPGYVLRDGSKAIDEIRKLPQVAVVAPRSIAPGMLSTTTGSAGVQVNGVIPSLEYDASQLKAKICEGKEFDSSRRNEVVVGKKLAKKMKLKPGTKLVLTLTDTSGTIVAGAFRVAAIYESNNAPLDEKNVYVVMRDLNALLSIGENFHEAVILLKKDQDISLVKPVLLEKFPWWKIESWNEISPETDMMVRTTDLYSYIIMVIVMIALAFGIINTMLMAILERTREVGMMMALGTSKGRIFLLVLTETAFLTLAGVPLGLLIGWLVTAYFNNNGLDMSGMGEDMMRNYGYSNIVYPHFPFDKLAGILVIVISTAFISSLLPAIKALRLRPVEALRR
jgi:putative ABC transport system permease protein